MFSNFFSWTNISIMAIGVYVISMLIVGVVSIMVTAIDVKADRKLDVAQVFIVLLCSLTPVLNTFMLLVPLVAWVGSRLEGPLHALYDRLSRYTILKLPGYTEPPAQAPLPFKVGGEGDSWRM